MTQGMTEWVIARLGRQGDGLAEGPVHVPRALPGERVRGRLRGDRLEEVRIVTPSPDRVAPPCRHYGACGGCQMQHAADGLVREWKAETVRRALAAQGLSAPLRPVLVSPADARRRAGFAARRTKKGALAGFHGRGSDVIVETPDCRILHPELRPGRAVARDLAILGGSRKAVLSVMVTLSRGGLDVAARGGKPADGPLRIALAELAARHDLARLAWEDEVIVTRAAPVQRFGPAEVVPPPGAFLQATAHGEAALWDAVAEITAGAARVADLFAGCGTFSLPLAARARVHAVEGSAAMVAALERGWRHAPGLKALSAEARDLFRRPLMPDELARFDAVVLDPPRAGAAAQVAELAGSGVPVIAYVSCNPVSFARDARVLAGAGYALDWVQVVDQFRWSAHVELAACFRLPHIGAKRAETPSRDGQ